MTRITLLLGAGFSCPFGYPTTKEFFDRLENKLTPEYQLKLLQSMKTVPGVKDVEHILTLIDSLLYTDKNNITMQFLTKTIRQILIMDMRYERWNLFVEHLADLKKQIIDMIYDQYSFKHSTKDEASYAIGTLFFEIPQNKHEIRDIFTLNYDRLIEEYFLSRSSSFDFVDGFSEARHRRLWINSLFEQAIKNQVAGGKPLIRLFKLHGSLNWREWVDGKTIECLPTEEPIRNTYYKRNVFIYPTEQCDQNMEPYFTLFKHFNNISENCDTLLVIGYAFRDEPINKVIENFILNNSGKTVVVVSPTVDEDSLNVKTLSNHHRFIKVKGKFPDQETIKKIKEKLV